MRYLAKFQIFSLVLLGFESIYEMIDNYQSMYNVLNRVFSAILGKPQNNYQCQNITSTMDLFLVFWGYHNLDKLCHWVVSKTISIIVMRSTTVNIQPLSDHSMEVSSQNMDTLLEEILEKCCNFETSHPEEYWVYMSVVLEH